MFRSLRIARKHGIGGSDTTLTGTRGTVSDICFERKLYMKTRWTKEQAWEWYKKQPWLRGSNFIPSNCANRQDMWQSYHADEHFACADEELALSEKIGFNSVRVIVDFDVWLQEPQAMLDNLETFLSLCEKHRHTAMVVLATEVQLPRGRMEDGYIPKKLGEQSSAAGYHQGRLPLSPEEAAKPVYHPMESPLLRQSYLDMLTSVVRLHRDDERVHCWNVWNEPGIGVGDRSTELVRTAFSEIRALDPIQPLAADVWRGLNPTERELAELGDVISFHCYGRFASLCRLIGEIRKFDRPLFCTEWLNRITNNNIEDVYPLFQLDRIASYCWGFVAGRTYTYEPWEVFWEQYENGKLSPDYDMTKWQHDLFRPNLRPYDPREIDIIREVNRTADSGCV